MQESFATVLETVADVRADRTAVTQGECSVTWRQVDQHAARVAIALYNGVEYLGTVFALLKLRVIPVNVNYRYQAPEMEHVFGDAHVEAVVFDSSLAPRVTEACAATPALHTLVEADGSITFHDRDSRVINTGGEKVYAGEAEQVIIEPPAVRDALVVGLPDRRFWHRVTAVVAAASGAELTEGELADYVASRLADYKKPRTAVFVDGVQRSPSGKADLHWATEVAQAGISLAPGAAATPVG